jgi:ribosomal protein S27AE
VVTPPKPINCPKCGKPTIFVNGHMMMVINERNNKCGHCGAVVIHVNSPRL